jgi:hypothetical protein
MFQRTQQTPSPNRWAEPKWFNSPVSFHTGTLSDIHRYIPTFERRDFAVARSSDEHFRMNERLDTIVRLPFREDHAFVPVGVVSKNYALVPHTAVLDVVMQALDKAKIAAADVKAEIKITEYGERMALSLYLPDKYSFDPGDGNPMALRLECTNSVDGSTRFRALMGWFRLVCSNGLIIGVTQSDVRRRHVGDLILSDVHAVLTSGISVSEMEKTNFERWRKVEISPDKLASWVDKELRAGWGFKAAARAFHIAQHGMDAEIIGQYKDNTPTTIPMRQTNPVPGTPKHCSNLFDVTQVLAWLAKERRDVQEQLEWREKIPDLTAPLLN